MYGRRNVPDREWAADQVESLPIAFAEKLLSRWGEKHRQEDDKPGSRRAANFELLTRCASIRNAHRAGVPTNANDGQLRQEAAELARDTARRLDYIDLMERAKLADSEQEQAERMIMLGRHLEALHWLGLRGIEADYLRHAVRDIRAALRRVVCARWWVAVLRRLHARAVETTARAIGLVHKRAGCYVSDDSLKRRQGQIIRNQISLQSVLVINEHGQDYTLAELSAKGPANRAIRRHELMTRIAGFELIARECGHVGLFITVTCPSRMHAFKTKPGQSWFVVENAKHDGTQVDEAQAYLCQQWRNFSETCRRQGLELYGFRIAEPNHDGTPHWHALIFFPKVPAAGVLSTPGRRGGMHHHDAQCMVARNLRRYFLCGQDSNERGAQKHRITIVPIDWNKGSATGYVAKYVAKNIDGYKVEKDLYGNDAFTSSQRVDAWASTWRIRQFQQIGGAPVGVWRELRRLHQDQSAVDPLIAQALEAVNITAGADQAESELIKRHTSAHGWQRYLKIQGGHRVKRKDLEIGILRDQSGELGRYGEVMAPKPVGILLLKDKTEIETIQAFGIVPMFKRTRTWRVAVESERSHWTLIQMGHDKDESRMAMRRARIVAREAARVSAQGEALRPWSPVNNCTPQIPLFGGTIERIKKRGQWHQWENGAGGPTSRNFQDDNPTRPDTGRHCSG